MDKDGLNRSSQISTFPRATDKGERSIDTDRHGGLRVPPTTISAAFLTIARW